MLISYICAMLINSSIKQIDNHYDSMFQVMWLFESKFEVFVLYFIDNIENDTP
jgi:hypothetical protein